MFDELWLRLRDEAAEVGKVDPVFSEFFDLKSKLLTQKTFAGSLSRILASQLASKGSPAREKLIALFDNVYACDPSLPEGALADIATVLDKDPAAQRAIEPLLYFKGFQALQVYRVAHYLWLRNTDNDRLMASDLQRQCQDWLGVDIHPAARIGKNVMIDHGEGVSIGAEVVIGNNSALLHQVSLNGRISFGNCAAISAGAVITGNFEFGDHITIGANACADGVIWTSAKDAESGEYRLVTPVTCIVGSGARIVGVPAKIIG